MRSSRLYLAAAIVAASACSKAPPVAATPPVPLSDSAVAAVSWVQSNGVSFTPDDSTNANGPERAKLFALTSGARVIGFSELVEGTHELPYIMRRTLFTLADSGVRGIALQASMADAMDVDRYVRGGPGDLRAMLRVLNPPGSERISTRETAALVEALRTWNVANPNKQIGFYGFEIPTAARAIQDIVSLPDSVLGKSLKPWLVQRYGCVARNEGAHWGLEGRTSDSTFWASCGPETTAAMDSVIALHQRSTRYGAQLAFAEQAARLIQHHVRVGLARLTRQDGNAEHVMYLLDQLGPNGRLVLWGGDVEMGRLTLDKTTIQTAVPLGTKLGAGFRTIAFTVGDGVVRARVPRQNSRSPEAPGISNAVLLPPQHNTLEDVLIRATPAGYWLDMRSLPSDNGGAYLKGPRNMRLISETYIALLPNQFETPVQFPANFDGVVFVKHATPARPF
ncbi:MAG TPA: erythromycin esterase family protein [Gemmatimonadaceae bacterium]